MTDNVTHIATGRLAHGPFGIVRMPNAVRRAIVARVNRSPSRWLVFATCALASACTSGGRDGVKPAEDSGKGGTVLYEQVDGIIVASCSFIRCHDPSLPPGGGKLLFESGMDIRTPLVGVPSCEYDAMNRVEPGKPDESWLMVKLTAPRDSSYLIQFTPKEKYTPASGCGTSTGPDGAPGFGFGMPATGQFQLDDASIDIIRRWIAAGAPGPR